MTPPATVATNQSELLRLVPADLRGACANHILVCYKGRRPIDAFIEWACYTGGRHASGYAIGVALSELERRCGGHDPSSGFSQAEQDLYEWAEWRTYHATAEDNEAVKQAAIAEQRAIPKERRALGQKLRSEISLKMRRAFGTNWAAAGYAAHAFVDPWLRTGVLPETILWSESNYSGSDDRINEFLQDGSLSVEALAVATPPPPQRWVRPSRPFQPPQRQVQLESPIEEAFYAACRRLRLPALSGLEPQWPLLGGRYRVDFAVPASKVAVELDGYEYHSSKEQKANDTRRQRDILLAGWQVIRFTGSEIHANVDSCVRQVADFVAVQGRQ